MTDNTHDIESAHIPAKPDYDVPTGSNADEWSHFLRSWGPAYRAVRVAEAIEAAEQRGFAAGVEAAAQICHNTIIIGDGEDAVNAVETQIRALAHIDQNTGAYCADCGRIYGKPGFPDLVVSNEMWRQISPTCDEGGLLCPSCICARLESAGLQTTGQFTSGPLAAAPTSVTVQEAAYGSPGDLERIIWSAMVWGNLQNRMPTGVPVEYSDTGNSKAEEMARETARRIRAIAEQEEPTDTQFENLTAFTTPRHSEKGE